MSDTKLQSPREQMEIAIDSFRNVFARIKARNIWHSFTKDAAVYKVHGGVQFVTDDVVVTVTEKQS